MRNAGRRRARHRFGFGEKAPPALALWRRTPNASRRQTRSQSRAAFCRGAAPLGSAAALPSGGPLRRSLLGGVYAAVKTTRRQFLYRTAAGCAAALALPESFLLRPEAWGQ